MRKHYVYGITNIVIVKKYIGTRSCIGLSTEDLGVKYFSSSTDLCFKREQVIYPDRFLYEVLKEFNTREEALAYEIELHKRYGVDINPDFYNRCKQTSVGFSCGMSGGDNGMALPLYQLNKDTGEIINEWDSAATAACEFELNQASVSQCCRGESRKCGLYTWIYVKNYNSAFSQKILEGYCYEPDPAKKVCQINSKTGVLIKRWNSIVEAAGYIKRDTSGINNCCRGKNNTCAGYNWCYEEDYPVLSKKQKKRGNVVVQLDLKTGITLEVYSQSKVASDVLNVSTESISSCARGKTKSSCGYFWKYLKDFDEAEQKSIKTKYNLKDK